MSHNLIAPTDRAAHLDVTLADLTEPIALAALEGKEVARLTVHPADPSFAGTPNGGQPYVSFDFSDGSALFIRGYCTVAVRP